MQEYTITSEKVTEFGKYLKASERSSGTVEKYLRDVNHFMTWLDEKNVTREQTAGWKEYLTEKGYSPITINSMLASIHAFYKFAGWENCRVCFLRVQRQMFREQKKELTKNEYMKLVETARTQKKERLAMLIETICATGIRVSEVKYLTVESLKQGQAVISLKGKIRTILLPDKLIRKLKQYVKKKKIRAGEIFITRNGNSMSRKQIWAEMKDLCDKAGIEKTKVFPHNLRHLFARVFYQSSRDIARLADVLGHSSIETTRIYLLTTGTEYRCWLDNLKLIS